ncbi:MAG: 4-hydroxythreonine-4-phosphate dehydrogenase PdxA [Bdellovibrionaceae bacterium]|nr:4-hydroxythreonine-4-phosphate dehydrogenase PdxA [Pseudobdellovibrionaceae bacterium]
MIRKKNRKSLLITSGDPDGIGFEVATKALCSLALKFFKENKVFLFATPLANANYIKKLRRQFDLVVIWTTSKNFSTLQPAFSTSKKPQLFLVMASDSPADWIYNLSHICLREPHAVALITGPLSKTLIRAAGYKAIGHTEILGQVTKTKDLYMGFVGRYFNVVLLTGHVPLAKVSRTLKKINWPHLVRITQDFALRLSGGKKPLALIAVNPHAGEKGMISGGEEQFLERKIKLYKGTAIGPLVPDAAFLKANWSRYSAYLCTYHDQGLIPFKAIHGQDSGVHVTLGLPFIRTSVDHGTAKEIFGKNIANPNSMREAILLASRLLSRPRV